MNEKDPSMPARVNVDVERIRCDVEDGSVWLHVGFYSIKMTPDKARMLATEISICAAEAEKHGG